MIQLRINGVPVYLTKFFEESDKEAVLAAIPEGTVRVVFLDTGATTSLAETIAALVEREVAVVVRDHHRGEGRTPEAVEAIEALLDEQANIVSREEAPGCAQLVQAGEFVSQWTIIVADPDLDGLTAAMKAAGAAYDEVDADAAILDGPRTKQTEEGGLSATAMVLVRAMATLPPYDKARPEMAERAKTSLFSDFVAAVAGDANAQADLEQRVAEYEEQVAEAKRLLVTAISEPCPNVQLADTTGAERYDLNTLCGEMERSGAKVTVIRKDFGPIAKAGGGIQYSLAVARNHQEELDLRDLVPPEMESSPEAGLLSNTSFLLHCSEEVWQRTILPGLFAKEVKRMMRVMTKDGITQRPIICEECGAQVGFASLWSTAFHDGSDGAAVDIICPNCRNWVSSTLFS